MPQPKIYALTADPWNYVAAALPQFYALQSAQLVSAYTLLAPRPGGPMPQLRDLPSVAPAQNPQTCAIDFGNFLPPGVTLTGTPTLKLALRAGSDPTPAARLVGGPTIGTAAPAIGGTGIANAAIIFKIGGCVAGATYCIEVYCSRSDGDVAEAWTRVPCDAPY